ncbi:MAG TPA: multiheme c-type cytochrome [Puia sp.]|nr:multiheme c-type cytochrome [Puia sp.]
MIRPYQRWLAIIGSIVFIVVFFATCMHPSSGADQPDPRGEAYAGAAACLKCHKPVCDAYAFAAHERTSALATRDAIPGSFTPPGNRFSYGPGLDVNMVQRDSGLFQVTTVDGKEEAHPFDIVVGSGRKAQTYLYWNGDQPFELPVSYFMITHSWANSPGFPTDRVWFNRTIPIRCFECHSSYIQKKPSIRVDAFNQIDQFDKSKVVYGIDCERCHGPAALHVSWQQQHPQDREAKYITRYAALSRQQKLDVCGSCHSGTHTMARSAFAFKPGDRLSDYYYPESRISMTPTTMDVHGNQTQLLMASKCYLKSETLVCTSCHDTHKKERDDLAVFSTRCMSCHQVATHKRIDSLSTTVLAANCIDCHLPARASKVITLQTEGQKDPVADKVRSHFITIYPEETKKFLAAIKH